MEPTERRAALVRAGHDRPGAPGHVFGGLRIDAKVAPADSAGALYVIEHTDAGKGGPPRHLHHAQDEWFYVLEGAYRADLGAERFELRPGDALFAPRGVPHVWAHVGEGTGRLVVAFSPAGGMESFLSALAEARPAPSAAALGPLLVAHGMAFVGPPLTV